MVLNFPAPEDRRVWQLARAAARGGWTVTVVSPALRGHRPGRGHQDDIDLIWFPSFEGSGIVGAVAEAVLNTARASLAVRRLKLGPGDVVHVCTPPDSLPFLLRGQARRGVGTLYDQHDVVPLLAASKPGHRQLLRLYDALERSTVRASSAVVTAGQVQADRLARLYGITPTVVRTAAPMLELAHEPPVTAGVLGYLGVLGEQDGVDRLINAMAVLRDRGVTEVSLRVAGDGPEMARLQAQVLELRLSEMVEMCGWLEEPALEAFLETVDGFVVPDPLTDFNHSCPMLKISHALGAGLPVVMTPLEENLAMTGGLGFLAQGDAPEDLAAAIEAWHGSTKAVRQEQGAALRDRWTDELHPDRHWSRYVEALSLAVRPSPARS